MLTRNSYGLDLGTCEIKVFDRKKKSIWREKNVLALREGEVFAVGNKAYRMYEKASREAELSFPMKEGTIAHIEHMQDILERILRISRGFPGGTEYVAILPADITQLERLAFFDLFLHSEARPRSVRSVEKGIADAVGMGLDVMEEKGIFVVDFGGETTQLSVLSSGELIFNRMIRTGGRHFDRAVVSLVRRNHDFVIGTSSAERLRREFGVSRKNSGECLAVSGRDLLDGTLSHVEIKGGLVQAAMRDLLEETADSVCAAIGRIPPDVRRAVETQGIFLTGGVAATKGLAGYLRRKTGLPVLTAKSPGLCSARGLRGIMTDKIYYKSLTRPMSDKNDR